MRPRRATNRPSPTNRSTRRRSRRDRNHPNPQAVRRSGTIPAELDPAPEPRGSGERSMEGTAQGAAPPRAALERSPRPCGPLCVGRTRHGVVDGRPHPHTAVAVVRERAPPRSRRRDPNRDRPVRNRGGSKCWVRRVSRPPRRSRIGGRDRGVARVSGVAGPLPPARSARLHRVPGRHHPRRAAFRSGVRTRPTPSRRRRCLAQSPRHRGAPTHPHRGTGSRARNRR